MANDLIQNISLALSVNARCEMAARRGAGNCVYERRLMERRETRKARYRKCSNKFICFYGFSCSIPSRALSPRYAVSSYHQPNDAISTINDKLIPILALSTHIYYCDIIDLSLSLRLLIAQPRFLLPLPSAAAAAA
jgi:hypothetical protein